MMEQQDCLECVDSYKATINKGKKEIERLIRAKKRAMEKYNDKIYKVRQSNIDLHIKRDYAIYKDYKDSLRYTVIAKKWGLSITRTIDIIRRVNRAAQRNNEKLFDYDDNFDL